MLNFTTIFTFIIFIIILAFVIIYFSVKAYKNAKSKKIGNNCEKSVKHILNKICKNKKYKLLNNIYLPLYDTTTEIDHIIIGDFGVLVVETKGLNGEVYGNEYEKNWTHIIGEKKHTLYNPLMQNKTHISCIQHILRKENIYNVDIYSLVVFAGNNIELNIPKGLPIITSDLIKSYFKKEFFKKQSKFNVEQVYNTLLKYKVTDKSLINKHNSNVNKLSKKG